MVCFALSGVTLLFFARRRTRVASALLLAVLFIDLAAFGQFADWSGVGARIFDRLADPPAVTFIKARAPDPHALRGIAVPAGEHRIEFVFRPASFRRGVICFLVGLGLLSVGAVVLRNRGRVAIFPAAIHKTEITTHNSTPTREGEPN